MRSCSPGWSGAASIMLSITGMRASAFVIWKVRTMPSRAIAWGGRPKIGAAVEADRAPVAPVEAGDDVEERGLAGAVRARSAR